MAEGNSTNVIELPEKPDVNWLLCYLFEATWRLDRTLALYKHWREIAKADPDCALDEILAPAVDEQMRIAYDTVGVLMEEVVDGLSKALGVRTDFEAFHEQQEGAS